MSCTVRYIDAATCLNVVLLYVPSAKELIFDRTKVSQLERKEEQMFQLLAILVALCPRVQIQYLDDRVAERLMENFADKVQAMRRGNIHVYDELFSAGCPRFITTNPPDTSRDLDTNQESYQNQLRLFVEDVKQNTSLPDLLQYMHLYSSISLTKLATLLDTTTSAIRTQLMCMKSKQFAKMHNREDTDLLSGSFHYSGSIEFHLDIDTETGVEYLMIQDNVVKKSHAQTMIRHIHKFQDIARDLKRLQSAAKETGTAS